MCIIIVIRSVVGACYGVTVSALVVCVDKYICSLPIWWASLCRGVVIIQLVQGESEMWDIPTSQGS